MVASPLLLVTLVATLLLGGLVQPIGTGSTCPPQLEVSPTDAAQAEAVVRDLVAALSGAAAPGADPSAVAAAETEVARLMVPDFAPPGSALQSLAALNFQGLPVPIDPSMPLSVGQPLELNLVAFGPGLDHFLLTVEVSNGPETRAMQFTLIRVDGAWRVLGLEPVRLDPAGCYVPDYSGVMDAPAAVEDGPPIEVESPVVVAIGSPVVVGEGELPPDAPPLGDPSGQFPAEPTGPLGLHVVNADGSGLISLAPHGGLPAWSPDGTRIAFSSFDPANPGAGAGIAMTNADGTGETPLTNGRGWDQSPAWSPDGTRLAFLRNDWNAASSALYVVNADGSGLTELADAAQTYPYAPSWSPDGRQIAFAGPGSSSDTSGRGSGFASDVWVVGADGSDLKQVTDLPGEVTGPIWSPDGTRIAFADTVYEGIGPGANALYVVHPDGTELTALTRWEPPGLDMNATRPAPPEPESTAIQSNPAWSPDGRRITFATIWGLAVIDADGADLTVHAVDELQVMGPVWSPDGTQIAFSGATFEAYPDIYVVNIDGSDLTRVGGTDWVDEAIAWSPDGRTIAFTAVSPGE